MCFKNYTLTLILSFVLLGTGWAQWETSASLPAASRHHPCTFSIGDKGYVVAGSSTDGFLDDCMSYDPSTDSWEMLNDFPGGQRGFAIGVSYKGKGYIGFGGNDFEIFGDLWEYDPETDMWKELADFPGPGRYHPALVAVNDKIYVGLGNGLAGNMNDWWEYDINEDTWAQKPNFPGARRHHPYQFSIGEYSYVGMGHGASIYNDLYRYDTDTEEWVAMENLPGEGRVAGTQFSYDGKGYVLSGQGMDHDYMEDGEFWEYDPETDSWESLESHPGNGSRWAPGSFVIDGTVYFLAGEERRRNKADMMSYQLKVISSNDEIAQSGIQISPNPATDRLFLNEQMHGAQYEIHDVNGRVLSGGTVSADGINVQALPEATYLLQVTRGNERRVSSFITQR